MVYSWLSWRWECAVPGVFWKVREFSVRATRRFQNSRRIVPVRDTGVTPGRAGRGFVPGAVLENVWSRELVLGRRAGKALPRNREKIGNGVMPGNPKKMGFK